jgi:primosomal protein N' (replication factor Y) (superfamily II helicase)
MADSARFLKVAVPAPLFQIFDYRAPATPVARGARVSVPFGRRILTGVVLAEAGASDFPGARLKSVLKALDSEPLFDGQLLDLFEWAAGYYHHPIGEVLAAALPVWLRQGRPASVEGIRVFSVTGAGRICDGADLGRAPVQKKILTALQQAPAGLDDDALLRISPGWAAAAKVLTARGLVTVATNDCLPVLPGPAATPPTLNGAQQLAVDAVTAAFGTYGTYLLHGVTGSGKTEVYLRLIERVLARGEQVLVLVPEIGLTPQLVARFTGRFRVPIAVLHSGLTDQQRLCAWLAARAGRAPLVLGTRSAVFTPLARPGLIVVDEEHDLSYKQQDGFRYSARDLAVLRASRAHVPVILGSATPALESLKHAREGNYRLLELPDRTGGAGMPAVHLLDMRRLKPDEGLSPPLRTAVAERLARGEQSLLFLNRRGFAPVLMCYDCGWLAPCKRCDARLTLHRASRALRCHHCDARQPLPESCPDCGGVNLHALGEGTERIEAALEKYFPAARIERIDRDSTRRKGALEEKLRRVHEGEADILVGTQMLSKGHDFPNVTLVGVLNADHGLYGSDFRASERLFQLIVQVAGRAGRADKPGTVLIQTWHPSHPLFAALVNHDFHGFADFALAERRETEFPPYSFLALLRAEAPAAPTAMTFLRAARECARRAIDDPVVKLLDPVPAGMERRAGRFRAQMLVQSPNRAVLQRFLSRWVPELAALESGKRVRWSIDVDPADMF